MRIPDLSFEQSAWSEGFRWVAGVDEAGRGAWAGPVAAAAVILPPQVSELARRLSGVRDSKTLSARQREKLFAVIHREAISVGLGMVGPEAIVEMGIAAATRQAMKEAVLALKPRPTFLLIDYVRLPQVDLPQKSIPKGDVQSLSIAAASICAKVSRDRLMVEMARIYPGYGFEGHKGYGTPAHRLALAQCGISPLHRYTWAPFAAFRSRE